MLFPPACSACAVRVICPSRCYALLCLRTLTTLFHAQRPQRSRGRGWRRACFQRGGVEMPWQPLKSYVLPRRIAQRVAREDAVRRIR